MKYSFHIEDKGESDNTDNQKYLEKIKFRNKISYFLISMSFGLSGISDLALQYHCKDDLQIEPQTLALITSLVMIPWMIKPLFGLVTDLVPVCGYRRKFYIIFCGILISISWIILAIIPPNFYTSITLMLCINIGLSFTSVLGEAIVVELSKMPVTLNSQDESKTKDKSTSQARDYISYFFFFKHLGSLGASIFKGILVEYYSTSTVFFIASFNPLLCIISGFIFVENVEFKSNENKVYRREGYENMESIKNVGDTDIPNNIDNNDRISIVPESYFRLIRNFICQKTILIPIIFIIAFVATPSYIFTMFYFITQVLKISPSTQGILSLFSSLATLLSIVLYKLYFKKKTFKFMILWGTCLSFCFGFCDFILVERINLKLGIPDVVMMGFSTSMLSMLGELMLMPILSLAALLSPKNLEGTAYSVFMSALNFGMILSELLGSFLGTFLGITKTNFDNFPKLIIIANCLTLLPLPFIFLISNKYFDVNQEENTQEDKLAEPENMVNVK